MEGPSDIQLNNDNVDENVDVGTGIGIFTTTDQDSIDHTYSLNTENVPFIIVGNNLITYGALNYEDVNSYNINVTTTDNDGLTFSKDFIININNLAEPPTDFTLDITTVDEDVLSGYEIGTFSVSNPNAGSIYSFTIDSSGVGVPFSIDGDKLITSGILDYETQNRYIFDVIATDGQYSITRNFSIDINNKPDAPHDIQLDNADIFENAVHGDIVGTFTTSDQIKIVLFIHMNY